MMLTKADEKWERLVLDLGVVVVLKDYPYTLPTQTLLLQSPAVTPPLRGALPPTQAPGLFQPPRSTRSASELPPRPMVEPFLFS